MQAILDAAQGWPTLTTEEVRARFPRQSGIWRQTAVRKALRIAGAEIVEAK